jgi:hypothetical protein
VNAAWRRLMSWFSHHHSGLRLALFMRVSLFGGKRKASGLFRLQPLQPRGASSRRDTNKISKKCSQRCAVNQVPPLPLDHDTMCRATSKCSWVHLLTSFVLLLEALGYRAEGSGNAVSLWSKVSRRWPRPSVRVRS